MQLRAAGDTQTLLVVQEDGAYRILTVAPMLGPLALMALERIEANDLAGARRWLDWARLELQPAIPKTRSKARPSRAPGPSAWRRTCRAHGWRPRCCWPIARMGERALPLLRAARDGSSERRPIA